MTISKTKTWHRSLAAAIGLGALAVVAFQPTTAQAACVKAKDLGDIRLPAACLSPEEGRAVRMRMFRADLAVAALSCGQQSQYNNLVTRHQDELVRQGRALRAIFQRVHPRNAERELNRFITHLANKASLRRLGAPEYCRGMARVFADAQSQPRQGLTGFVGHRPVVSALLGPQETETVAEAASATDVRAMAAMETAAGNSVAE